MPARSSQPPKLTRHKGSGRGVVRLSGQDFYCGPWPAHLADPPPDVREAYDRVVAEWLASGRRPLRVYGGPAGQGGPSPAGLTVNQLMLRFVEYAQGYYRDPETGADTGELANYKLALRPLRGLYGNTPAAEFGPKKLAAVREKLISSGLARRTVNARVDRIKRLFGWAASEELVPVTVYQALRTLAGLRAGRTDAPEAEPVGPVPVADFEATLPFLPPVPRAIALLQRWSGMRPGEVCRLKLAELDRSGPVWAYRPQKHKNRHHGKGRVILLGARAQAAVLDHLAADPVTDPDAFVFDAARDRDRRFAAKRAARKSRVQPSQRDRKKAKPVRVPKPGYRVRAYAHAVARACVKAGVPHWHPNQLRHLRGTEVRQAFGLEAAQVVLGHSKANITEVYAARDAALAAKVVAETG